MKKILVLMVMVLGVTNMFAQEAVDLGLSVKWADRNVGASNPRDVGTFYAWGELETKSSFTEDNYMAGDIKEPSYEEDSNKRYYYREWGIAGSKNDVARQKLTYWRMPNVDEFKELRDNCQFDIYHDFQKDEFYCIVTGPNGNTITLPVVGYITGTEHSKWPMRCIYWSSNEGRDFCLSPQNKFIGITGDVKRYYGCLVRPIRNFSKGEVSWKEQQEIDSKKREEAKAEAARIVAARGKVDDPITEEQANQYNEAFTQAFKYLTAANNNTDNETAYKDYLRKADDCFKILQSKRNSEQMYKPEAIQAYRNQISEALNSSTRIKFEVSSQLESEILDLYTQANRCFEKLNTANSYEERMKYLKQADELFVKILNTPNYESVIPADNIKQSRENIQKFIDMINQYENEKSK